MENLENAEKQEILKLRVPHSRDTLVHDLALLKCCFVLILNVGLFSDYM